MKELNKKNIYESLKDIKEKSFKNGGRYDSDGYTFKIDDFYFCLYDFYKYRSDNNADSILICIGKQPDCNQYNNGIPFMWFNMKQGRFNPFYQSRKDNHGSIQGFFPNEKTGIQSFKEYKKLQKKYRQQCNEEVLKFINGELK